MYTTSISNEIRLLSLPHSLIGNNEYTMDSLYENVYTQNTLPKDETRFTIKKSQWVESKPTSFVGS